MPKYNKVKDSGKRQEFKTGSVRDTDEGKGTPHLVAGEALNRIGENVCLIPLAVDENLKVILNHLRHYSSLVENREQNIKMIYHSVARIISYISKTEDGSYSSALKRLSVHYENGAKKYDKNNWRKGQPISRYYDSSMRHLLALIDEKTDEDHASALLWNLVGIVQTKIDIEKGLLPKELNDFPFTIKETFDKTKKKKRT